MGTPTINIMDRAAGQGEFSALAKVEGPCYFGGCSELCCDSQWNVSRMTPETWDQKINLGDMAIITKKKPDSMSSALREMATDSDTFTMEFKPEAQLAPQQKATMIPRCCWSTTCSSSRTTACVPARTVCLRSPCARPTAAARCARGTSSSTQRNCKAGAALLRQARTRRAERHAASQRPPGKIELLEDEARQASELRAKLIRAREVSGGRGRYGYVAFAARACRLVHVCG